MCWCKLVQLVLAQYIPTIYSYIDDVIVIYMILCPHHAMPKFHYASPPLCLWLVSPLGGLNKWCVYIYIYICVCVCVYIYHIYIYISQNTKLSEVSQASRQHMYMQYIVIVWWIHEDMSPCNGSRVNFNHKWIASCYEPQTPESKRHPRHPRLCRACWPLGHDPSVKPDWH